MAEEIEKKLSTSPAFPHYVSLLRHLLLIPRNEKTNEIWKLFVLILQQISLQTSMKEYESSMDPGFDEIPIKFSMDSVISKLKTHLEFEKIEKEMEKMQKELNFERKKNLELENRISDLLQETDGFSITSFLRSSETSSNPSDPCPSSPQPSTSSGIPECRPPIQMPPPPPPPSIKDLKSFGGFSTIPKKSYYPKPPNSMKALNWKILPQTKIKGTIFEKAEDEKMLKLIDLEKVAEQFASGKDHSDAASTSGTLRRRGQDCHSISILESRRAQNFPRFEQRLRCLNAIRSFQERTEIINAYANAVLKASTAVQTSKKLKQFVSLVLALGNYLNHSKHNGNASGFMVESFRALTDVRSNLRHDMNLLHFIIQILDSKLPEVLKISKEIGTVFEAAKFSRTEMETEIKAIQESLKEISNELTAQKCKSSTSVLDPAIVDPKQSTAAATSLKADLKLAKCKGDKFVEVVESFLSQSQKQMHEIEKLIGEMSKKVASPDEFFGHFSKLLTQFSECQTFLWELREEEERQKRQTIAKSFFAKKQRRSPRNNNNGINGNNGNPRDPRNRDFEKLIDAIQSGDIFSEDLTRLRTSFRIPNRKSIRRS
uniref:FH2 domain-containing protein n=1 Tax=Panagrolaimus sp. PS1159 TaxID=55785 RepID=A0AC35FUK0_9BILA